MNDLQRFNVGGYGAMVEDEDGTYCRYEDVAERIEALEASRQAAITLIREKMYISALQALEDTK